MDSFSTWVLNEVDQRGWTPAELARRAGLNTGTLSNILNGNRRPGPEVCRAIAKALGEPEEKVFRLAGLLSSLPASNDPTLVELQELVKNLPPAQRKQALDFLRFLYQSSQVEK